MCFDLNFNAHKGPSEFHAWCESLNGLVDWFDLFSFVIGAAPVLHDIKLNINIPNFIYMYCLRQVCVCATLPPWSACTVHLICQHCCIMIHKPLLISHIFNKQTTNRWESKVEKPGFAARCGEWSASKVWSPVTAPRSSLPLQSEGQTIAYLGQREAYL